MYITNAFGVVELSKRVLILPLTVPEQVYSYAVYFKHLYPSGDGAYTVAYASIPPKLVPFVTDDEGEFLYGVTYLGIETPAIYVPSAVAIHGIPRDHWVGIDYMGCKGEPSREEIKERLTSILLSLYSAHRSSESA